MIELGAQKDSTDIFYQKPLHKAVFMGHIEVVKHILDVGANIENGNGDGFGALHYAAEHNQVDIIKLFIERGATIEGIITRPSFFKYLNVQYLMFIYLNIQLFKCLDTQMSRYLNVQIIKC